MQPYDLTPAADADLAEIARYTLCQWGERQQRRYQSQLLACFRRLAGRRARARNFSEHYPQVQCQHHYVFFIHRESRKPLIIAVLHERMDLFARIGERLAP
jgi:plasmid stabilization system protein ParE